MSRGCTCSPPYQSRVVPALWLRHRTKLLNRLFKMRLSRIPPRRLFRYPMFLESC
jgi:hypothetical protein